MANHSDHTLAATQQDAVFMARAIELARLGAYTCMPNPMVGCVITQVDAAGNTVVIGEGWHQQAGKGHAEVNAMADAREKGHLLAGATAYVTLEPCSHWGRTPPCSLALIEAKVARVVFGFQDPNPQVSGNGLTLLRESNVEVVGPVLESEASVLNKGFNKRMSQGIPYVMCKSAMSVDGRTAMASGESQWITGPQARAQVQKMRAKSCAIVTGIESILHDDSSLTVRAGELTNAAIPNQVDMDLVLATQPMRVVLDSRLRIPLDAKVLQPNTQVLQSNTQVLPPGENGQSQSVVMTCVDLEGPEHKAKVEALQQQGVTVFQIAAEDSPNAGNRCQIDGLAVLKWLAEQGCNNVLLETGATLAGSWLQSGLIDELKIFMAPVLMGNQARGLFNLPFDTMSEKQALKIDDIRAVGDDWLISAKPA